jgi:hypothetical protein
MVRIRAYTVVYGAYTGTRLWCLRALASAPTTAPRRCRPGVVTGGPAVALIGLACGAAAPMLYRLQSAPRLYKPRWLVKVINVVNVGEDYDMFHDRFVH